MPATIVAGDSSLLSWKVEGSSELRLEPGLGLVTGSGLYVQPAATTAYTLIASNEADSAQRTLTVTLEPLTPPPDPQGFSALTIAGGGIALSWKPASHTTGYLLERRSAQPNDTVLAMLGSNGRFYFDGTAVANQLYTYRLTARNAAGASPGIEASGLAAPPPPEGPSLTITPVSVTLAPGQTQAFAATSGSGSTMFQWRVLEGDDGGTVSSSGMYTAPAGEGVFHLAATESIAAIATISVAR